MEFRARYSPPVVVTVNCTLEEGMTKSEFADECDINQIMARYQKTGVLPESAVQAAAQFGDFTEIPDFVEMQDKVIAAHDLFNGLPAVVRDRYHNDPSIFLDAVNSGEARDVLVEAGLLKKADDSSLNRSQSSLVDAGGVSPAPAGQADTEAALTPSRSKKGKSDSESS